MSSANESSALLRTSEDSPSVWGQWRIILFSSQAMFLWCLTYTVFVPLMPFWAERYGFGPIEIGIAYACLQIGWLLSLPVYPWLLNLLGSRAVVFLGVFIYSASQLIFVLVPDWRGVVASRAVEGCGIALLMPTVDTILTGHTSPEQRGRALGLRTFFGELGKVFGMLVSFVLDPLGGLKLTVMVISALGFATLCLNCLAPVTWFEKIDRTQETATSVGARLAGLLRWNVVALLLLGTASMISLTIIFVTLPLHLKEFHGYTMVQLSLVWLLADVLLFPFDIWGGQIADLLNPWWITICGIFAHYVLILMLGSKLPHPMVDPTITVLLLLLGSGPLGLIGPSYGKLMTEIERREGQAVYQDIWAAIHLMVTVSTVLGSLLAGYGYETIGFHVLFTSVSIVGLIITFLVAAATWQLHSYETPRKVDEPEYSFRNA